MARKAKSSRQQRRRAPKYEPRDHILIVCEGTKTEKHYFEDARQAIGVQRGQAIVEVESGAGSNPKNIVETARKLKAKAMQEGNAFSSIYCVFDHDEHAHFSESIDRAESLRMKSITSVPCFEYWILLHFCDHNAPYVRVGDRSPCACCLRDVQKQWSDYEKSYKSLYTVLNPQLANARQRAERRITAAQADGSDNPSTEIHRLLDAMEALKETKIIGS